MDVSGLPIICENCGISYFSLQKDVDAYNAVSDEVDSKSYCSGECKWSVIMYDQIERHLHATSETRFDPTSVVLTM
ncbi:unnamed protein product [Albugo candida]|uniref:Uncharacterized protein n=1 Tax=Albugo candida TaxID=65357 RepID=A0A024GQA6_9STRA|nr:unnamed protein product [Albugo candida]|eukprot:CCI48746.1 unnamed protein product [Albugo candida]